LLDGVEIVTHMVDAAAGRRHEVVEAGEVAHKQRLGVGRFCVEPAVCHRLAAAGLIVRVTTSWPNRSKSSSVAMPISGKNASM